MNRSLTRVLLVGTLAAMGLGSLASAAGARPSVRSDAVSTWNANAGDAALAACLAPANNPLHESRLYAAMHLAVHDALNAIERRSRPYAFATQQPLPGASLEAAVAAAARDVLVPLLEELPEGFSGCVPAAVASVETDYAAALAALTDDRARQQGIQLGRAAAATILAVRTGDGADTPLVDDKYPQGDAPGEYRFTPGFDFAFAPGWADVTPFVLKDSSQFRADPPYGVTTRRYAADFAEVKRLGGDAVTTPSDRTAEQTEIARFWAESSPLQWNRIARNVSASTTTRSVGPGAPVRPAQHGARGRLHRLLRDQVLLRLLAPGDRDTASRHRRQPEHARRPDLDPAGAHASDPGPRLGAQRRRRCRSRGDAAVLRHRSDRLQDLQPDACSRQHLRPRTGHAQVRQLLPGGRRERTARILIGFHFRNAVEDGLEHGRRIGARAVDRFLRPAR